MKQCTLSYSTIQKMECPRLFWRAAVQGIKGPASPQLLAGAAVHEMAVSAILDGTADAERLAFNFPELSPDVAMDCAWMAIKARNYGVSATASLEEAAGFTGDLQLIAHGDDWKGVYYSDPAPAFYTKIDALHISKDKHLELIDWKSGWAREGDKRQAEIYCALVDFNRDGMGLPSGVPMRFIFANLRNDDWSEVYTFSPDDIAKVRADLIKKIKVYQGMFAKAAESPEKDFPPCPCSQCVGCPFKMECEACPRAVVDEQSANQAGRHLALLEAQVKETKDALKQWVTANGPAGGYGFKPGTSAKWDAQKFIELAGGIEAALEFGVISIDGTKASKLKKDSRFSAAWYEEKTQSFGRLKS